MKTKYKYIYFAVIEVKPKTNVWGCFNNATGAKLGEVKWYPGWRQYCFFLYRSSAVFSGGCLADINDFIGQVEKERRTANNEHRTSNTELRTTKKMKIKELAVILNKVEPQDAEVTAVMIGIEGEIKWRNEETIETVEVKNE